MTAHRLCRHKATRPRRHRPLVKLLAALMLLLLAACDVHEFPDTPPARPVDGLALQLSFALEMPPYQELIYETGTVRGDDDDNAPYTLRYVVNIFPYDPDGKLSPLPVQTFVVSGAGLQTDTDKRIPLDILPGHYRFMVWADYTPGDNPADHFYDTTDFTAITLTGEHHGNTDYRDAFRGVTDMEITPQTTLVKVAMQRPMAKFKFVATDLEEFLTRTRQNDAPRSAADLENYRVRVCYTGFMPHVYDMTADKPIDAKTGTSFFTSIHVNKDNEAELGFDYVFVNGHESSVQVTCELYDPQGNLLSSPGTINVPLKRSQLTLVKGRFLTASPTGGVGIVPEYDGEFNIVIR